MNKLVCLIGLSAITHFTSPIATAYAQPDCTLLQARYDQLAPTAEGGNIFAVQDRGYTRAAAAIAGCHLKEPNEGSPSEVLSRDSSTEPFAFHSTQFGSAIDQKRTVLKLTKHFKRTDTIYAEVATVGRTESAELEAIWTFEDGQTVNRSAQTIATAGGAITDFHISKPDGWPDGKYQFKLLIDGVEVDSEMIDAGMVADTSCTEDEIRKGYPCKNSPTAFQATVSANNSTGSQSAADRLATPPSASAVSIPDGTTAGSATPTTMSKKVWQRTLSTVEPSFDCAKASLPSEVAICHSDSLRQLDANLGHSYQQARNAAVEGERQALKNEQSSWIATRNTECGEDGDCLEKSIKRRIYDLTTRR